MTGSFRVKRSGGPRTEEGKAVAARNALKTGIYATSVVMPGESEEEFVELRDALLVELGASGVLEASLVHDLAVITWKKARLDRLEHRVVIQRLNAPETGEEFFLLGLERTPENEWALSHLFALTPEAIAEIDLRETLGRRLIDAETRVEAIAQIQQSLPELFDEMHVWVRDEFDDEIFRGADTLQLFKARRFAAEKGSFIPLINLAAVGLGHRILAECQRSRRAIEALPKIEAIRERIHDERLSNLVTSEGPSRARDDLNRAFFRTLKEFRTQQAWRRSNEVIDVSPERTEA